MKYISKTLVSSALFCASFGAAAVPMYSASLNELNGSGVSGTADLTYNASDQLLTVDISASGLEPGAPHPQHIHGRFDGGGNVADSFSPTLADDTDGDGFVELAEGLPQYGPVLVPLTSPAGGALENFPTADDGTINFSQTYDLTSDATFAADFGTDGLLPLENREIVLHGLTLAEGEGANGGEANGEAGYKATLPVASGEIVANSVPEPGTLGLMALGFAMVGGMAATRNRAKSGA
jgi:hypothetical protein